MNTIETIRAEIERRKNTAETIRERNICIDILSFLDTLQEKSGNPINPVLQDFPTTDEEMQHFLATHKPVQVPDKYKTPDFIFQEQPVCDWLENASEKYATMHPACFKKVISETFKAGATWQKEHDAVKVSDDLEEAAENYAYGESDDKYKGFLDGATWQKEQMMRGWKEMWSQIVSTYNSLKEDKI
jgi:hypothetical protein